MPTDPSALVQPGTAPADLGYRMPAEWAPHQATWFSWPHNLETWPADKLAGAERVLAQAVRALTRGEAVHVNVLDAAHETHVRNLIGPAPTRFPVYYHRIPTNDAWCRDHGAIFVVRTDDDAPLAATDWGYNAWGGKYPPFDLDQAVPARMAEVLDVPRFTSDMILEGGSIDVNGAGVVLTTEACLLNPNRNPSLSKADIEVQLQAMLGLDTVFWLGGDLAGDDTDGHIDNLARFVGENTIVTIVEDDPADENFAGLQENLDRLRALRTPTGTPLRVLELPMPAPVVVDGVRLPASYANFYIGNRAVLLPQYQDPNDAVAAQVLAACFPDREVVRLDCRDILWGLGAFHCLSQQVPAI